MKMNKLYKISSTTDEGATIFNTLYVVAESLEKAFQKCVDAEPALEDAGEVLEISKAELIASEESNLIL